MERDGCLQSAGDLSSQDFRQQLDRWFERNGVVDNLRSHLRSLMVAALQRTEVCLKPRQKTSPKTQSANLIVAEYLLRHGCHYTLSVLMSELPALANFGSAADQPGCDPDRFQHRSRYRFQDKEIVEILNCFGLSSAEDNVEHFCESYRRGRDDDSLLECLLDLLPKIGVAKAVERCEMDKETFLSKAWVTKVNELLVAAKDSSLQLSTVLTSLSRITEEEVERTIRDEKNKQMRELVMREKRIQEQLKNHEEEMLLRLRDAEKELNERRVTIDKELTERQLHLGRMALQWQEKHNEILALSKDFEAVKNENKALISKVIAMEKEIKESRTEIRKQIEIIDKFETEKTSFKSRVQELLKLKEAASPSKKHDMRPKDDAGDGPESDTSDAEDGLLGKVKSRIKELEDESSRLTEKYSKIRRKYEDSDDVVSEVCNIYAVDPAEEESPEPCIDQTLFLLTPEVNTAPPKDSPEEVSIEEPLEIITDVPVEKKDVEADRPAMITPTRRQQKNRDYYLESRNLLEIMEKTGKLFERGTFSSPDSTISLCSSASSIIRDGTVNGECKKGSLSERVVRLSDDQCLTLLKEATHRSATKEDEIRSDSVSVAKRCFRS
ncbi:UNVERIFIED_CONTAM: hypothetical protein PYX00_006061 [Menopon gallinae]|uniref:LisH domain-containing protein n=1 Tax=Menopon gallinae TaxID=328185 RepID=A0AAW2HV50_9NEOP